MSKKAVKVIDIPVTMTSLQIAELTGKQHKHVLTDIRTMLDALYPEDRSAEKPADLLGAYKDSMNRKQELYQLNYELTLTLVTGYSIELRHTVVKRWMELEREQAEAKQLEKSRVYHRELARLQCPDMTKSIEDSRTRADKNTQWFHYANEFDMINRIVLGCTSKQFRMEKCLSEDALIRDYMTTEQVTQVQALQNINRVLIDLDMDYEDRKGKLESLHTRMTRSGTLLTS